MSLAEQSLSVFRTSLLIQLGQLLAGAAIGRALGPTQFGLWFLLLMIPTYAEVLGRVHVDEAAVYFLGTGRYPPGQVAFGVILAALVSAGAIISVFVLLRVWLFPTFLHSLAAQRPLVYWMALYIPISFVVIGYGYLFLASGDVKTYNTLRVITALLPWLVGAVVVSGLRLGLGGLVAAQLAMGAAGVAYAAWRFRQLVRLVLKMNARLLWDMLAFGVKLYVIAAASFLNTYVSGALVALHLSAEHVAFYRLAQNLALTIAKLPESVSTVLYPRIAQMGERGSGAVDLTRKSVRVSLAALVPLTILGTAVAGPVVRAFYGRAFEPAVVPLIILLPGVALVVSTGLVRQHFTGRGRPSLTLLVTVAPMLVQIWLLSFAVPRFGIVGAAAATSAAFLLASLLHLWVFSTVEGVGKREMVRVRREDLILLLAVMQNVARVVFGRVRRSAAPLGWKGTN